MDTITLKTVIDMINNQLADYKERMSAKGFDMNKLETPAQGELIKLRKNLLESYIEAKINAAELQTEE